MTQNVSTTKSLPTPRRYLALWFPLLPTDRIHRQPLNSVGKKRDEPPLVIVESLRGALRLVAVDQAASRLGLTRGLTLADARARISSLAVVEADAEADARTLERLALYCTRFTPLVALDGPEGLVLDITGCAHLFGGELAMRERAVSAIARLQFVVRATVASTPESARALARFSNVDIAFEDRVESLTRRLPIAALAGVAADTTLALARAGLKTLGDLADRPSRILAARFGEALVSSLARTLGRENVRITPLRPPPAIFASRHFAEPLMLSNQLEGVLKELIEDVRISLEERGEGGRAFEAIFFRSDGDIKTLRVETGRPTRDVAAVLRLFSERLSSLTDPIDPGFGFDSLRLDVLASERLDPTDPGFDGHTLQDQAVSDLVDNLVARFGRDRVLRFEAMNTHDPDRDARLVSAQLSEKPSPRSPQRLSVGWPEIATGDPPARPVQMFDPPQPIEIMAEIPDGPPVRFRWRRVMHHVVRAEGPERIAPEWWRAGRKTEERDYYRIEDGDGRRFWIFRHGPYLDGAPLPRWFLHGLFA